MYFNFKKDIEYAKIVLNFNDTRFSEYIGVSRVTLSRWLNDKTTPDYDTLENVYDKFYSSRIRINKLKEEMYKSSVGENHIVLFHGAKKEIVGEPTIEYSEEKKDFGKGFYLGETFNQSASFVNNYPNSSVYIFDFNKSNVKIKEYSVSKEWMILVAYFRGKLNEYSNSKYLKKLLDDLKDIDVVVAPIADNTMYTTLDDFISGKITDLQCLNALSANRLGMQYVFLNDETINNNLVMCERCFYCKEERTDYYNYRKEENEIGKNKVKIALREYAGKGKYIEDLLK